MYQLKKPTTPQIETNAQKAAKMYVDNYKKQTDPLYQTKQIGQQYIAAARNATALQQPNLGGGTKTGTAAQMVRSNQYAADPVSAVMENNNFVPDLTPKPQQRQQTQVAAQTQPVQRGIALSTQQTSQQTQGSVGNTQRPLSFSSVQPPPANFTQDRIAQMYIQAAKSVNADTTGSLQDTGVPTVDQEVQSSGNYTYVPGTDEAVYDELLPYYEELEQMYADAKTKYGDQAFTAGFDFSGLSDTEKDYYENALLQYRNANDAYEAMVKQYETNNKAAAERRQKEYLARELLKKYLPTQLKHLGMSGLGVTQSAMAELENGYRNRVAGIDSEVDTNRQSAIQQYLATAKELSRTRHDADLQVSDEASALARQELENKVLAFSTGDTTYSRKELADMINASDFDAAKKDELSRLLGVDFDEESNTVVDDTPDVDDVRKYGIQDLTNVIDVQGAQVDSFGKFLGTGSNGKQDEYISKILSMVSIGEIQDGDVVDMNFGVGTDNYVLLNGKFYKTSKEATYNSDNVDTLYGDWTSVYRVSDSTGIRPEEATVDSFGKHFGTGNGTAQDKYVNEILDLAKRNLIPDGTYIDFNYGAGARSGDKGSYVYYGGQFYKTDLSRGEVEEKAFGGNITWKDDAEHNGITSNTLEEWKKSKGIS